MKIADLLCPEVWEFAEILRQYHLPQTAMEKENNNDTLAEEYELNARPQATVVDLLGAPLPDDVDPKHQIVPYLYRNQTLKHDAVPTMFSHKALQEKKMWTLGQARWGGGGV